ncbi:MAG: hypothetical protein AABY92_06650, partial [Thermodesulfobacteriota bacterium]
TRPSIIMTLFLSSPDKLPVTAMVSSPCPLMKTATDPPNSFTSANFHFTGVSYHTSADSSRE